MKALSANAQEFVPTWLNQHNNSNNNTNTNKPNQQAPQISVNNPYQNYGVQSYQPISYTPTESTTPIALQIPQNYIISTSQFSFIPQPITIHAPATQINFTPSQLISPSPPLQTTAATSASGPQFSNLYRHPIILQQQTTPLQLQQQGYIEYQPAPLQNIPQIHHQQNYTRQNNKRYNNNNNNNKFNNNNNKNNQNYIKNKKNFNKNNNNENYDYNQQQQQQQLLQQQLPQNIQSSNFVNTKNNIPKGTSRIFVDKNSGIDKNIKINKNRTDASSMMPFELNENEFPSLNNNNLKQNNDVNTSTSSTATTTVTVLSENQKMLIKNVNFLKTQVEQFYKSEENSYNRQQQQLNEQQKREHRSKLSFKEALEKPREAIKLANEIDTKLSNENNSITKKILTSSRASSNDALINRENKENETSKVKKRRRSRKKSKKSDNENSKNDTQTNNEEFQLVDDEFPDLNSEISSSNRQKFAQAESIHSDSSSTQLNKSSYSLNSIDNNSVVNINSTGTDKNKLNSQQSNKTPTSSTSGKKSKHPMVLEFANMISELEKNQQEEKRYSTKVNTKFNDKNRRSEITTKKGTLITTVNPLDSAPTGLRGKEREKPKNKKPSTLKKIILKEREEKKRTRQLKNEISKLSISSTVSVDSANKQDENNAEAANTKQNENESYYTSSCNENENEEEEEEEEEEDDDDDADGAESTKRHNKNTTDATSDAADFASEDCATSNQMSPISQGSPLSIGGYTPGISPYAVASVEALSPAKLVEQVKEKIHSKRFREYCNQIVNKEIDTVCTALLQEIVRFQDRMYHKNPLKAKMRRRYVMGIREVTKHLKLKKIKCIILAPNCEKIQSKGGLDEAINRIIEYSIEQDVPFVFALGRKGLGKAVNKLVPISVIGIFDFSGAEQHFKRLVELADSARSAYNEMVCEYEAEERKTLMLKMNHVSLTNYNIQPTIPCHYGHSRTPSNGSNISIDPSLINYRTHSRTPSGNFNFLSLNSNPNTNIGGPTGHGGGGHSRSASGGGGGTLNIDLSSGALLTFHHKHLTHSRTPSNCSNISFVSRLSEPISEVGVPIGANSNITINSTTGIFNVTQVTLPNSNATIAAVQYYSEQVRNEMRECDFKEDNLRSENNELCDANEDFDDINENEDENQNENEQNTNSNTNDSNNNNLDSNISLSNLHLSCIHEIDAGNEADIDEDDCDTNSIVVQHQQKRSRLNSKCATSNNDADIHSLQQKLSKIALKSSNDVNDSDGNSNNNNNNTNDDETINNETDSTILINDANSADN